MAIIIRHAAGVIADLQYCASSQLMIVIILYAAAFMVHITINIAVMEAVNPVLAPYLPQATSPPPSTADDAAGINATTRAFTNSSSNNGTAPNMSREDTIRLCTASQRDPSLKAQCEQALYSNVGLSLDAYTLALTQRFGFCLNDPVQERNATFGFGGNLTFLSDCFAKTAGLMMQYMCSGAEVRALVGSLVDVIEAGGHAAAAYARMADSVNCNQSRWSQGCEPGWAKSMRELVTNASRQLFYHAQDDGSIPFRTDLADLPCCDGFFCPRALGCMLPCPLGAQCTRTSLVGGLCAPYDYPLTPGVGYSCGGANLWASLPVSTGLFCPAGSYCPSTTDIRPCDRGHFCRQGSTVQTKCFQLANCGEQSTTQHLQTYGVILTLGLASIIVVAYNCSNWIRKVRRKREKKVREKAIRQVKESASAAKKWRSAASVVKKLGRTISGVSRSSSTHVQQQQQQQQQQMTGNIMMQQLRSERAISSRSESMMNVMGDEVEGQSSSSSGGSRRMSWARGSGPVDMELQEALYEAATSDHESASSRAAAASSAAPRAAAGRAGSGGDAARPPARWSKLQTKSQILRYAYGQIEIEKAMMSTQNKGRSWKELLEVAAGTSSRDQQRRLLISGNERLRIEICFHDLSLYLKSNGKKILCNVTGKLSAGRVTAVMGPSGAGKTTFLNALAGKAYNSYTTGTVLINGRPDVPIQCYKKVIGFVAQDDIVHGNLTVEENLWFSARYRLPASMLKADRVLVVERIIDALGLEQIRSSKVGTVEKRGISGGQRKRVNVGLEMVMEPSLLILDEPTSGLDSTSSFLVLRALRREAQAGVNVGVVLHQPSYGLFRMFDDVMLLAKGGRTVYLGPVDRVEEYFAGMNIVVPERINPPDHFMDVLEGITRPGERRRLDPATLPLRWIHHNGYDVPPDLHPRPPHHHQPAVITTALYRHASTFARSRSLLLRVSRLRHLRSHWDDLRSTFARYDDLSDRTTPGFFGQFKLIICRVGLQRIREARLQMQDYFILLLCGTCLGAIVPATDASLGSSSYAFVIIAVSLLCMVASLRTFNNEKLQYWRESASGINRVAYFLAKDAIDLFNVALKPVVFLCMFYFFNNTRSTFGENYVVTLALIYCVTGIAYIFAVLMDAGPAQLWSVFLPIVATLLATKRSLPEVIEFVRYANYAHWALQAYVIANAKRYAGVWLITRCALLYSTRYDIKHWTLCLVMLFAMGLLTRFIALLCLIFCNRRRQQ